MKIGKLVSIPLLLPAVAMALAVVSCTFKGTTKFSTDATSDVTATTSGKSWFTTDGLLQDDQKVNAFVTVNFENLRQDAANGRGEYLASLSALLGVQQEREADFLALMQDKYGSLFSSDRITPVEMLAALSRELPARPPFSTNASGH